MRTHQIQAAPRDLSVVEPSGATPARPAAMNTQKQVKAVNQTAKRVMHGRCVTQGHTVRQQDNGQILLQIRLTPRGLPDSVIRDLRASLPDVRLELTMASSTRCAA